MTGKKFEVCQVIVTKEIISYNPSVIETSVRAYQSIKEPFAQAADLLMLLNSLGRDGWELVSVLDHNTFWLKREKKG